MNTETNRKKIASRIRNLLAKTVDAGCSEEEAMTAAIKAKALMDKYQIKLSETELEEEGCFQTTSEKHSNGYDVPSRIAVAIQKFAEVKVWKNGGQVYFFGLKTDSEFASWLTNALTAFIWRNADQYADERKGQGDRWLQRRSFADGAIRRINERLMAEVKSRKPLNTSTGKSLVVVKSSIINREFSKLGVNLTKSSRSKTKGGNGGAYSAGQAAGNRASFGKPVNSGGRVSLIA